MILCSGEALIDMLPRETVDGENCFSPHAGGAVFNTAIALARLGAPTGFFSGISTDLFGAILEDRLTDAGVDSSFAARSDKPTTLAFVTLTGGHAKYAFYDENTAGRMLDTSDLPNLPDSTTAAFFGGISLAVEPCAQAYESLMTREASNLVTMIDPNVRDTFIKDEKSYRARINRMMDMADIIKVSDEDLEWLAGHDDTDKAAAELLKKSTRLVCVTQGADGVSGYTKEGHVVVEARRVQVVDTVGAGDTFNAGVLASLYDARALTKARIGKLDEEMVIDALTLGVRAAAVTVSRAGANPPRRDEL